MSDEDAVRRGGLAGRLHAFLADIAAPGASLEAPARVLARLIAAGLDRLPLPGHGATLQRWQALAEVAFADLSLAKLYEGHTDALAILAELGAVPEGGPRPPPAWGVWAAEGPGRVSLEVGPDGSARLRGTKSWCSGAASGGAALLTAWHPDGRGPQLVSVALDQPGIGVDASAWAAVGMAGSASVDVTFDDVVARCIGAPGDYLSRPGFWHGGAGIAACWYGGASALADTLRTRLASAPAAARDGFRMAALGRVDVALAGTAGVLRAAAAWIDAHPTADARRVALQARLSAEATAATVLAEVGRALGAGPFCRDARFARTAADLPVFIRQSHAERDLAALGAGVLDAAGPPWTL